MKPLGDFLRVALVVQPEKAVQDLPPRGFGYGESDALSGFVEVVVEIEVGPAVSLGHGVVHLYVEVAEFLDVWGGFFWVVEAVVGGGEALPAGFHDGLAVVVVLLADLVEVGCGFWEGEGFKTIGRTII